MGYTKEAMEPTLLQYVFGVQNASTKGFGSSEGEYPALQHLNGLGLCELLVLVWYILQ